MFDDALNKKQFFMFELREHNPKFLLGILCIIGCPVQLVSKFFEIAFVSTLICLTLTC